MSFFKPYRSASSKVGCDTVTGKNKIWLYVGSVSFTLTFSTHWFCSLQGHCLYIMACLREPCTSAWNVKPKCLLFRETSDPVLLWTNTGSKKLTCLFPEAGHSRRCLQDLWPFCFTVPLPTLLDSSRHPDPNKMVILRWSVYHLFSQPEIKSLFLASIPRLQWTGLSCGEQNEFGLGNNTITLPPLTQMWANFSEKPE